MDVEYGSQVCISTSIPLSPLTSQESHQTDIRSTLDQNVETEQISPISFVEELKKAIERVVFSEVWFCRNPFLTNSNFVE